MAKKCPICEKTSHMERKLNKLRGKYNPSPKFRKKPKLQWVSIPEDIKHPKFKEYAGKRILICAKCIKTLAKDK
jgi:hypothetical protein